jgi:hypothetical protein
MNWDKLDEYERAIIKWQYKMHGSFFTHLWDAIWRADEENLRRLELGFPIEVKAYRMYIGEGEKNWYANAVKKWKGESIDGREAPVPRKKNE